MTSDHYDVAIIGTGAGGGTLGHRLATSGKRVLWLERGPFLPRELDNWDTKAVFVRAKYLAQEQWFDRRRRRVPTGGQLLRRREHQVLRGRVVPAAPRGLRRDHPPRRHLTGVAHRLRRPRALLHARPSSSTRCTGATARTRRRGPPASSTPSRRSRTRRGSSSSATTWRRPACIRSTCRSASTCTRTTTARPTRRSACIRCSKVDGFPCLLGAKSDAQTICVEPALGLDNVTLVTEADVRRLETDADRAHRHQDRRRAWRTARRSVLRRRRRGGLRAPSTPPPCCSGRPTDTHPDGLANGSGVVGRHYMRHNNARADGRLARAQPDHLPEDHGGQRLVPRAPTTGTTRSAASRCSASPTTRMIHARGAAVGRQALARHALRAAGPPRRRLLALRRGPSACRTTGSRSTRTARCTSASTRRTTSRA